MEECVICCASTPPLYRVCICNTVVHESCIVKVVNEVPSHKKGCPICQRPYVFNTCTITERYKINISWMIILFAAGGTIIVPLIANLLCCHTASIVCGIFHCAMTAMSVFAFLGFSYMWVSYCRLNHRVCPCVDVVSKRDVRLKMPHQLTLA